MSFHRHMIPGGCAHTGIPASPTPLAQRPLDAPVRGGREGRRDVAGYRPGDPDPELLFATVLHRRRGWWVMWVGGRTQLGDLRDFRAASLTDAVTKARVMAEEHYSRNAANLAVVFLLWIFGRRLPVVNKGLQLVVIGEPGQLTATDARDGSILHGATLEDVLAAAGVNPAQPADYHISWSITIRDGGHGSDAWPPPVTR
jgi:hypothetical protein